MECKVEGVLQHVGILEFPPKFIYELQQNSRHIVNIRCTWVSKDGKLIGVKTPKETDVIRRYVRRDEVRSLVGSIEDTTDAVTHWSTVNRELDRLQRVHDALNDVDRGFISALPLKESKPK